MIGLIRVSGLGKVSGAANSMEIFRKKVHTIGKVPPTRVQVLLERISTHKSELPHSLTHKRK